MVESVHLIFYYERYMNSAQIITWNKFPSKIQIQKKTNINSIKKSNGPNLNPSNNNIYDFCRGPIYETISQMILLFWARLEGFEPVLLFLSAIIRIMWTPIQGIDKHLQQSDPYFPAIRPLLFLYIYRASPNFFL